jgi:hypothetical protein
VDAFKFGFLIPTDRAQYTVADGDSIIMDARTALNPFMIRVGGAGIFRVDSLGVITTANGPRIFTGSAANGDAVYAEVGTVDATGSIYLSTAAGAIYIQKANAGAAADWYKVTATDAD